jgi:peroxiredoxin
VTEAAAGAPAPALLAVGTAAPDLRWTLDGAPGSLSGARGHPVLLAFVATWCPHCQAEVAVLNAVQDRFAGQGLQVIGVSASPVGMDGRSPASLGDLELFVRRQGARYPHLFDAGLVGAQRYGVRGFPTLYLVDADGIIRYAASGEVPEAELARAVQAALPPAA